MGDGGIIYMYKYINLYIYIYIYIYIYTYEYRVSGHLYEYRVSGQFTSWIYINKINITLHFFTHVETVGVGYINNYFFISSL